MPHLIFELAIWTLLAFFGGCALGSSAKAVWGREAMAGSRADLHMPEEAETAAIDETVESSASANNSPLLAGGETNPGTQSLKSARPAGIGQARGNKPDNLQRISGIGPKNERTLHSLGFFHFDQIAAWTDEEVAWVDNHLKFNGRIVREEWILQASLLAEGREVEFNRLNSAGARTREQRRPRPSA